MRLKGRRVLLVYGLLGEVQAALRRLGVDYMHGVREWLEDQGADVTVVRLPTASSVQDNGVRLAAEILSDPRPALVIAHSKGGLETLAALTSMAARARCAGFVALQSPFGGSHVADAVAAAKPLASASIALAKLLRTGTGEALRDLTTTTRAAWMAGHARQVEQIVRRVPTICVATELKPAGARGRDRIYLAAARWMALQDAGPNDGLVPVASALLPGTRHLLADGSHIAAVSRGGGRDPIALVARALALLEAPSAPNRAGPDVEEFPLVKPSSNASVKRARRENILLFQNTNI